MDDDPLDRRQRLSDACDLRCGLPAAANHPEGCRARLGQMTRGDSGRRARAELTQLVSLDHRLEPSLCKRKEQHDEWRARRCPRIRLQARVSELSINACHHRELAVIEWEPLARSVVDRTARLAVERLLDGGERICGREQREALRLAQGER